MSNQKLSITRIKEVILQKRGWRFESASLNDASHTPNPESLALGHARYPTVVSPDGAKIGLDSVEIYLHNSQVRIAAREDISPNRVTLSVVWVPEESRKNGYAAKALREFMSVCGSLCITILAEPVQIKTLKGKGSMTTKQLVSWYKRLGWNQKYGNSDAILEWGKY